ncbi:MAG: putative Ig domain-containing protein [Pirellulales bacterium]
MQRRIANRWGREEGRVVLRRGVLTAERTGPRRLVVESLERRLVLSATTGDRSADLAAVAAQQAEPDLVAFAQAIDDASVTLFGAAWCGACTSQKELFEDGAQFLPFVEVTNPDGTPNAVGTAEGIQSFPTWERADGTRFEGLLGTLQAVSDFTGVPIPTSGDPFLAPINDTELLSGAPLHIPLDGYDPSGGPLAYAVSSSNESLVASFVPQGNRSLKITAGSYGDMVFELFEQRAPRVTDRIIELAESGFYNGVIFHRVINGFMIQGGDPTGTGTGGSDLGDFDDQFRPDLQHTSRGLLSMAKSGDDTNDSQFFITEGTPRFLDFNHSVFGQLVEGEAVREAVSNVPTDGNDRPLDPIVMTNVEVFRDEENRVLVLSANEGESGESDITVTVTDQEGNQFQRTFRVTVIPDSANGGPYLDDIPLIRGVVGSDVTFQLVANDVEGDPVSFAGQILGEADYSFDIDGDTGEVVITPPAGFVGTRIIGVGVTPVTPSFTGDAWDTQVVTFEVAPLAPTLDLLASSDSGLADDDNITRNRSLDIEVSGVSDGDLVTLFLSGTEVAQAEATGDTVVVTVDLPADLADGSYDLTTTTTRNEVASDGSSPLTVTIDTVIGDFTTTAPNRVPLGATYAYDVGNEEEAADGSGVLYELAGAPTGMTIDGTTGQIIWNTSAADALDHQVVVRVTDAAGNAGEQAFRVIVNVAPQLDPIDAQQIDEHAVFSFGITASDANLPTDQLTFSLEGNVPQGATLDPVSGQFTWTPAEIQGAASYAMTVRVTDVDGLFDEKTFTVDVAEVDTPPTLDTIDVQTIEEESLLDFTATASDPDRGPTGPIGPLQFSLVGDVPLGTTIDPTTGRFTWTPTTDQAPATYAVTVRVTDPTGLFDLQTVTINTQDVNVAPTLVDLDPQVIAEADTLRLTVTADDENLPSDTLTYRLGDGAPAGAQIDAATGELTWTTPAEDEQGSYTIPIVVTDAGGLADNASLSVEVTEVNRPPQLDAILDRTVNPSDLVNLTATATDPDLPVQGIRFTLGAGAPHGANIDPMRGVFTWTVAADAAGPFDVTIVATDLADEPLSALQRFTVTVNQPPLLTPVADQTVREGETLRLVVEASDLQPTPSGLRYALLPGSPTAATIDPISGELTYTPSEAEGPSTVTMRIRVTDALDLDATLSFNVHVQEVNRPPTLAPIGTQEVTAGETVRFQATAGDTDLPRQRITYSIGPGQPKGASIDPDTGQFSWSPAEETVGTFQVTVRATDAGDPALSASRQVRIRVSGRIADAGFGIALAIRSSQIESLSTPPLQRLGVPVVSSLVPGRASNRVLPRLVTRMLPQIALGRREMREPGSGGGDVTAQKKSLGRHRRDDKVTPATANEVEPRDPRARRRSQGETSPGNDSGQEPVDDRTGATGAAVDRAIIDLLFEQAE